MSHSPDPRGWYDAEDAPARADLDSTIDQGQSPQPGPAPEGEGIAAAAPQTAAAPPVEATDIAEGEDKSPVAGAAEGDDIVTPCASVR